MFSKVIWLDEIAHGRDNNFNLFRMIAASCVLVSHSFPIAQGLSSDGVIPYVGLPLGSIAVTVFFCLSGFLIAKSYDRSPRIRTFIMARAFRLIPGLAVALFLTAYVLGPLVTVLDPVKYITTPYTARYVLSGITFIHNQSGLPGVFVSNPDPETVNASLWTLRYEVYFYVMAAMCGLVGLYRRRFFALFLIGFWSFELYLIHKGIPPSNVTGRFLLPSFVAGMTMYAYRSGIPIHWLALLFSLVPPILLRNTPFYFDAFSFSCSYVVLYFGYKKSGLLLKYNSLGDYSYGMYIYAHPIQQTLVQFLGPLSPLMLTVFAFPVSLVAAILSWTFVERPALSLGRSRKVSAAAPPILIG